MKRAFKKCDNKRKNTKNQVKITSDLVVRIFICAIVIFLVVAFSIVLKYTVSKSNNSNRLICTGVDDTDNVISMQEITVNFVNKKMNSMNIRLSVQLPENQISTLDERYNELMDSLSSYSNKDGYKVTGEKTSDTAIINLAIDPTKTTDENNYNLNATKSELKKSYEKQGYKCK